MWETLQDTLDDQIVTLESNARSSLILGVVLFLFGIAATIVFHILFPQTQKPTETANEMVKIAPAIIQLAIASYQYRPFASSRERRSLLRAYRTQLRRIDLLPETERRRLLHAIFGALGEMGKR